MQVKICGLTRSADAELAVSLGASHLGCVLAEGSPRCVSAFAARKILASAPARVEKVLVFRSCPLDVVLHAACAADIDVVQLHGFPEKDVRTLEDRGLRVRRVVDVSASVDLKELLGRMPRPLHLDVQGGGSGTAFNWSRLRGLQLGGVFVAGGIRPDNVALLLDLEPEGVDVSSGVESSPGIKDPEKLRALFVVLKKPTPRERTS